MRNMPLEEILDQALKAGADSADLLLAHSVSLSAGVRLGKTESLERSESFNLGLRVFKGKKQAIVSTNDVSDAAVKTTVERAVAMAAHIPEDDYCGIAPEDLYAQNWQRDLDALELEDRSADIGPERLLELALEAEEAAMSVKGIENSEGASAGWGPEHYTYMTSNGFKGSYARTGAGLSVSVLAGKGTEMERDYAYHSACHFDDLESPAEIGKRAAERTLRRLNPQKISTAQLPVVYDPRVSNSLLRHLAGAVNGSTIARGTSFLKNDMGKRLFAEGITVTDDPRIRRGLRSQVFDDEGVTSEKLLLVEDGVLQSWVLDLRTARQLKLQSCGRASRDVSSPPSPSVTNLFMGAGDVSPSELIGDIKRGVYITELIGSGVNLVTGDYSRGAFGYLIENGEITSPVTEIAIAGNLRDMWLALTPANDLRHRYGIDAPTLRIEGMTVAGN